MPEGEIDLFMRAIASIESGGASNPVNVRNERTGAHGLFQIMPENWAPWAQEAGLGPNAPRTEENQRKVARHKMLSYYDQFGSWDAVAVAWFAGPGRAQRYLDGDRSVLKLSDGYSTVEEYVTRLDREMGSARQSAPEDVGAYGADLVYDSAATIAEVFGVLSDRAAQRPRQLRQSYGGRDDGVDYGAMMANAPSPTGSLELDGAAGASGPAGSLDIDMSGAPQTEVEEEPQEGSLLEPEVEFGPVVEAPTGQGEADAGAFQAAEQVFAAQAVADGGPVSERAQQPTNDPLTQRMVDAGEVPDPNRATSPVVATAEQYLGTPYLWGGTSPEEGFDCSGLVQHVFNELGVELPRTSAEQAQAGEAVASLEEARPGDLVFWQGRNGSPNHIGIYAGDGQFIEAPLPGEGVRYRRIGEQPDAIRRVM